MSVSSRSGGRATDAVTTWHRLLDRERSGAPARSPRSRPTTLLEDLPPRHTGPVPPATRYARRLNLAASAAAAFFKQDTGVLGPATGSHTVSLEAMPLSLTQISVGRESGATLFRISQHRGCLEFAPMRRQCMCPRARRHSGAAQGKHRAGPSGDRTWLPRYALFNTVDK